MERLTAIFTTDTVDRLLPLYSEECERLGNENDLTPGRQHTMTGWDGRVSGPAQHVMFFIGFVAGHGESALLEVVRQEAN